MQSYKELIRIIITKNIAKVDRPNYVANETNEDKWNPFLAAQRTWSNSRFQIK